MLGEADATLTKVIDKLAADLPLPTLFHDHPFRGGIFEDCRDCNIGPRSTANPMPKRWNSYASCHHIFRLMVARSATQKALPFEPLVPTTTTVAAVEEARRGGLKDFANSKALLKSLIADD